MNLNRFLPENNASKSCRIALAVSYFVETNPCMEYEAICTGSCPLFNVGHCNPIVARLYIEKFIANILIARNVVQ